MDNNRRKFLSALGASIIAISPTSLQEQKYKEIVTFSDDRSKTIESSKSEAVYPNLDFPSAGVLHGTGHPVGIDGTYKSQMYWGPADYREDDWIAVASLGPSPYEDSEAGHIVFNRDIYPINDYIVYHERGHNLGFRHGDGGIIDYYPDDRMSNVLHETTKKIAHHSDGLHTIEWDGNEIYDFLKFYSVWQNGYITTFDIQYIWDKWQENDRGEDMYSSHYIKKQLKNNDEYENEVNTGGLYRLGNAGTSGTQAWW